MKRIVVELAGNLTFCGVNKGLLELGGKEGVLVETDSSLGLKVWCPNSAIIEQFEVTIDE